MIKSRDQYALIEMSVLDLDCNEGMTTYTINRSTWAGIPTIL